MSGIYIHIPFCKQACYYCDFHFSTNLSLKEALVNSLCDELNIQKEYLKGTPIKSIYFGGGTPSLLDINSITKILNKVSQHYVLEPNIEITLEANPEDLERQKLHEFIHVGINRLSIGIQSFYDPHLKKLNRAHHSKKAISAIKDAQDIGFKNISIDLIYGIPASDHSIWEKDLRQACLLNPTHISAYNLTIEPRTVFGNWVEKGKISALNDAFSAEQFALTMTFLKTQNYHQYEISNFSLEGSEAIHNTNYWKQIPYLGIGPSAHSYNLTSRQYNCRHNYNYIQSIKQGIVPFEIEVLNKVQKINEFILTRLRTCWGCDLTLLYEIYSLDLINVFEKEINTLINKQLIHIDHNNVLTLTTKGKFFADEIALKLFLDEDFEN